MNTQHDKIREEIIACELEIERLVKKKNNLQQVLLEKNNENMESLTNKIGGWTFMFENKSLEWSKELYAIFEINKKLKNERLYNFYKSCFNEDDWQNLNLKIQQIKNGGHFYEISHSITLPKGTTKIVHALGFGHYNEKGILIGIKGFIKENQSFDLLPKTELQDFFEASIDLQCIANESGHFIKISPSWIELLGYTEKEIIENPYINFVHPEDLEKTLQEIKKLNKTNITINFENRYLKKSGEYAVLNWNARLDPQTELIYCTARDVTHFKDLERQLRMNIQEKDLLIKEVHHRVKNNLQVISSLLSLQSKMEGEKYPKLKALYEESQNRINSMATIHEMFYRSNNIEKLDFKEYLYKLVIDLIHSFKSKDENIALEIETTQAYLSLDTAIPLGLIINEIIANSLKHAFENIPKPKIFVRLTKENKNYQLKIGDNGVGFNLSADKSIENSLGLTLIYSLADQLDSEIKKVKTENGTCFQINFSI